MRGSAAVADPPERAQRTHRRPTTCAGELKLSLWQFSKENQAQPEIGAETRCEAISRRTERET